MRHYDCINYINLDCEKGMCALDKVIVPIDGEGSEGCPRFEEAPKCGIGHTLPAEHTHVRSMPDKEQVWSQKD